MKRPICSYYFRAGGWQTECGLWVMSRPSIRCEKCGKKPEERKDVTGIDRTGNGITR